MCWSYASHIQPVPVQIAIPPKHLSLCLLLTTAVSCCAVCSSLPWLPTTAAVQHQQLQYNKDVQLTGDLRSTLWHWKLGSVLVFESEQHVQKFRDKAHRQNKTLNE